MSTTPSQATGWFPEHTHTALPPGATQPQQANAQAGLGQAMFFDGSGNVALNDGATPGLVCAGVVVQRLSTTSTVAGAEAAQLHTGYGGGQPASTAASDGFTASDVLTPAFDAGNGVPGKLSNLSGNDRSFLGVVLGLIDGITPRVWAGPIASAFARMLHSLTNESAGNVGYAQDATASTDLGTLSGSALATIGFVIPRAKRRIIIGSVEIIPSAALSHAATNYRVIQLWKVDTTGTVAIASSPLVATFSTLTQDLVAGQPTAFTLGAASALILRETDILVGTSIHTSGGATVPQSAIRALGKVI